MEQLSTYVTPWSVTIYFACALSVWYLLYGFEMYLNSGSLGRGRFWVFKCFWEELWWYLPGGLSRRADYIRKKVGGDGLLGGYAHEEIRRGELYEVVAKEVLPRGLYFWLVNVMLYFVLGPFFVALLVPIVVLVNLFDFLGSLIDVGPE